MVIAHIVKDFKTTSMVILNMFNQNQSDFLPTVVVSSDIYLFNSNLIQIIALDSKGKMGPKF